MTKISLIIPLYPSQFRLINSLLNSINSQTVQPDQIILVASQVNNINFFLQHIKIPDNRIKIVTTHEIRSDGINRNVGMKHSTGDLILFFDPKYLYHPQKIEITKYLFENTNFDLFLHSFDKKTESATDINDMKMLDYNIITDLNDSIISSLQISTDIAAIDKKIKEKYYYPESPLSENKFCQDIVFNNKNKVIFLNYSLNYSSK